MSDKLSGIIKSPCIVTFNGFPEHLQEYADMCFLTGILEKDFKGRFAAGLNFRSSQVEEVKDDLVRTANSLYQVIGSIDYVELHYRYLTQVVREYIDPRHIKALVEAGYTEILPYGGEQ